MGKGEEKKKANEREERREEKTGERKQGNVYVESRYIFVSLKELPKQATPGISLCHLMLLMSPVWAAVFLRK